MKISVGSGGNAELRAKLQHCHENVRRLRAILQSINDKVIAPAATAASSTAPTAIPPEVVKEVHEGLQIHIDVDVD